MSEVAADSNVDALSFAKRVARFGVWDWDLRTGDVRWSEGNSALYGLEPTSLLTYEVWRRRLHSEDLPKVEEAIRRALEDHAPYDIEFRVIWPDSSEHWLSVRGEVVHRSDGTPQRMVGVNYDISDRKRSEERFQNMSEVLPQLLWITNPAGENQYCNSQFLAYSGLDPAHMLGMNWVELIHPDDVAQTFSTWRHCLETGEPYENEYRLRRHDGVYRWFLARASAVRDGAGRITNWFGSSTDIHEFKLAAEALRANQERLGIALANSETGTYRWNPATGEFSVFDNNLKAVFGVPVTTPIVSAEDFVRLVHPDDVPALVRRVEASRLGADFEMEFRINHPDGSVHWLYDRGKMQRDSSGKSLYLVGACTDITRRKLAEQEIQRAAARYETALQTIPQLVWVTRADGYHEFYNRPWYEYTGASPEETAGRGWATLLHPDDVERAWKVWNRSLQTGEKYSIEYRFRRHDGEYRWFLGQANPARNQEGQIVKWFGTCTDIHAQKVAEAERESLLAQNEAIFASLTEGIVICDLNGKVVYMNDSALQMHGISSIRELSSVDQAASRFELQYPDGRLMAKEDWPLARALRGEVLSGYQCHVRMRDSGQTFIASIGVTPVKSRDGKQLLAAITIRDITADKRTEETLRKTEKLAAAGRLAASIAHEINNPLEAVTNLLYLMRGNSSLDDEAREQLAQAEQELGRVTQVTTQTLRFHRQSSAPTLEDIGAIVDLILSLYQPRFDAAGVSVLRERGENPQLFCYAGEIRQVLANLISNALDATRRGGRVRIRVKRIRDWRKPEKSGLRISVADTGIGMGQEVKKHIFEPFFTTKEPTGTGLGLWVSSEIIEKHGGRVRVYSKNSGTNTGTVMSIFFPDEFVR